MSSKAKIVVANKADLLAGDGDPAEVEKAREKLRQLEKYVRTELVTADGTQLDVIPISAKFSTNLNRVVALMQTYVQEDRGCA